MSENRSGRLGVWFLGAFLIGLVLRSAALGALPLSDAESTLALQALSVSRGGSVANWAHAGYTLFTGAAFFLFGSSDFLARLWPALTGSLIVLVPYLFRRFLGDKAALAAALILAVEPFGVALSRQAGDGPAALVFLLLGLGLIFEDRPVLAGISIGLALFGGPSLWAAAVSLLLAVALAIAIFGREQVRALRETTPLLAGGAGRRLLFTFLATVILFGTLVLWVPAGVTGIGSGLAAYFAGWGSASGGLPFGLMGIGLAAYDGFFLVLGLIALAYALRAGRPGERLVALWAVTAFVLVVLYPSRQAADLFLPMSLLCLLSGGLWVRMIEALRDRGLGAVLAAILFSVWLVLALLGLAQLYSVPAMGMSQKQIAPNTIWIGLLLLLISFVAAGLWRSFRLAGLSLAVALCAMLGIYTLSATWRAAGLGTHPEAEMVRVQAPVASEDLLMGTLGDLSEWNTGRRDAVDVTVMQPVSPALEWALRGFEHVQFAEVLSTSTPAPVVLSQEVKTQPGNGGYRGEAFTWQVVPAWGKMQAKEWARWVLYRDVPLESNTIVLWAQARLFPYDEEGKS
jgi:hypothetical protein